jgi:hypothetical protein
MESSHWRGKLTRGDRIGPATPHAPQLIAAEGDGLNGGHGYLGNLHAVWVTIQQEDID